MASKPAIKPVASDSGLGAKIRMLRRRRQVSQVAFAQKLGISSTYLNLIEHNRRPLTAELLIKLAEAFDIDVREFASAEDQRRASELLEVFSDSLFDEYELAASDIREFAGQNPAVAAAVVALYRELRHVREASQSFAAQVTEGQELAGRELWRLPSEEVSEFLQRKMNHFPLLEAAAESLWSRAALKPYVVHQGLVEYLKQHHSINVQITAADELQRAVRYYDPQRRILTLSEVLPTRSRNFALAHQIALLEESERISESMQDAVLSTDESRKLCRVAMASYFAAAVVMPYATFLEAAKTQRYDVAILGHRFRTSHEQVCHRLTTLRRPGAEGIPFHFLRVDIAGNISKRFSASGMQFARFSGSCPRWGAHAAFLTPGRTHVQLSQMPDGTTYFDIAFTETKGDAGYHTSQVLYAVSIGCPVQYAKSLVYADGIDLEHLEAAVPVGVTCRLCERMNCEQRAVPPLQRRLHIDENVRTFSFYAPMAQE